MARKSTPDNGVSNGMWLRPNYSLKGERGERAWADRNGGIPNSARMLELADIACGVKKPSTKKKRTTPVHDTTKNEPYGTK